MQDNAVMINGVEWIIVEKKGVIFTPWQLVAHAVNLKREEHTWGHISKSSHMSTDKEDPSVRLFCHLLRWNMQ